MISLLLLPIVLLANYAFLAKIAFKGMKMPRQWDFEAEPHDEFFARQTPEFMRYHQEMMAAGFELTDTLFTQSMSPTTNNIATYRHKQATTVAAAITSMSNTQLGNHDYIDFYERYTDGSSLSMFNSGQISVFPNVENIVKIQCDDVDNVHELLNHFRQVRTQFDKTPVPLLPDFVAQFHEFHTREMQALVDMGYLRISDNGEYYVGTYTGALKMTWKILPVGKQIYMAQRKRYAKKWLA